MENWNRVIMENWNEKLHTAAGTGNVNDVKKCLENKADIDYQTIDGRTALMWAAMLGHLEICRLLIDTGCKIDITSEDGWTALMLAAVRGHLEVCRLLIDSGCKIDITSTVYGGETALMMIAEGGHLEICRLLIDSGCKIDITTRDGYTALHWAARKGHLQTTRCLVEQGGASPLVTTHEGETPYDLAAAKLKFDPGYKEVVEYLQTVMSEKSSSVPAGLKMGGDMVPTEIKLMADKRSIDLYLKLLQSGYELKRDIRLVVVGKKGAGKTSLIRRLFGEEITDVTSTNGIEIHKIKCKAMSDDGIWNKQEENYEDTQTQARLLKQYVGKLQDKRPIESHRDFKDNTSVTSVDESKKSETASKLIIKPPEAAEPQSEPQVTPQQPSEQATRDFETMITAKSKVDVNDKEEYATFLLWDFAGDEEFYHTHQTFLSQDAMYLVVTKLNEADDHNAQALFRLWINSIHCYSRLEERKNTSEKKPLGDNDPPVVIVGTWKDAVTSETDTKKIEIACRENLLKYTNELADDERGHVRCEYLISNKDDECIVFQQIRQNILNLARGMRTWNIKYPLKFIQLEQRLQKKKEELPIISYHEIKDISTDIPMPLSEEELILFLEFHHELRALVYFKDLSEYIILDTQWLSDAFRCIVTAQKFLINIRNQKPWNDFFQLGKLNNAVLEDIFKNETTIVYEHKDFILKVMEKFDIIIHPNKSVGADENHCYYVPCMIKEECKCDIYEMFNVPEDAHHRSTWLCFKFRFLPPHLKNHLIASLSRRYSIAQVGISNQKKMQIAIFRNIVVFELQKTKLRKLLVTTCPNAIQIQVLEFGKGIERGLLKDIADFVEMELEKIIHTRFNMSNVKFEKKWECGLTKPEFVTGINDFGVEQMTEYYCETCIKTHKFMDEWSGLESKSLCLLKCFEDAQHSNPHLETSSKKSTFSTKVHWSFQAGMQAFSDVTEESTRTGSLTGFSKEEINFAKMGMIVLNILADVLYDLLRRDKPHLPLRSNCDITYLYKELRRLNKHVPTHWWGETWQNIQITDIAIGDDIERIRLLRNDLQHSKTFKLDDILFHESNIIIVDLVGRFDLHNKPTTLYTDQLKEIMDKQVSKEEMKCIKLQFISEFKLVVAIDIEMEQQ
ncbi:uncharacterized protein LOC134691355 [Mytilus trossulus]|uniref:uncharacterized protein LOC134691355 n=1 Tax=Mytilus trossulus TaxID=6551 RepID=UPI0030074C51